MQRFRYCKKALLAATPFLIFSISPVPALASDAGDWGSFGVQTRWIDAKAAPGDDFDRYANGIWNDTVEMPEDKSRIGAFISLGDQSQDRLKGILDGLVASEHPDGSDEARIAAGYSAFMDQPAIDAAGLAPARPYLKRIYAAKSTDDLAAIFASPGYASPVGLWVDADEKQSDRYALYIGQSGLGMPDREYYLSRDEDHIETREKYQEYLTFLMGKLGYADPKAAAHAVYSVELRMAQEMWDRRIQRNRDLVYNKLAMADLPEIDPDGRLRAFLSSAGLGHASAVIVAQLPPTQDELQAAEITHDEAAAKIGGGVPAAVELIGQVPLSSWQAYLAAHFLSDHADVLPGEIYDESFAFYGTQLRGQPKQRQRWKRGIDAVEGQVGDLLGKIYAQRYYPPAEKAAMEELVGNLRSAMAANLEELSWMGSDTRAEAKLKLDAFTPKIGAPDKYRAYEGLEISSGDALANDLAASKWGLEFMVSRLGKPVDRSEWFMFPHTVNAYYYPTFNEIVFPAAILQPPFFNLEADPAVNYGAIGAVIGHEMGHGFDDQGAKSDGDGNLRDWWTSQDKANFEALQEQLVAQYNTFCPLDDGKTCVDGELTLGENIGDLGGLSLAYRAYRLSLGGKQAPVIDGFTGDQRFFLAWAQVWRGKSRDELARQYLVTDPHSPPKYRVNGIVRNFEEWYRAFDVKPGDALYLPPNKRLRIW
ncbi:MAG: M13 family metallopeptidase [Sphingomonadaceae bacterium]|nr:M13 family metallopeptidase [Sphingomonadaceae bacterium]